MPPLLSNLEVAETPPKLPKDAQVLHVFYPVRHPMRTQLRLIQLFHLSMLQKALHQLLILPARCLIVEAITQVHDK